VTLQLTAGIKGRLTPDDCINAILNNDRAVLQSILLPIEDTDIDIVYLWQVTAPAGTRVSTFFKPKQL
jgi:hypothetical protein